MGQGATLCRGGDSPARGVALSFISLILFFYFEIISIQKEEEELFYRTI